MSWNVTVRHELRGDLVCETPLYVGGWDDTAVADLAVARDGLGRPVIPGTSVAGALRSWLAGTGGSWWAGTRGGGESDRSPGTVLNSLFGWARGQEGAASRIRVDDAPLIGDGVAAQLRAGVGIDRNTRSAAAGFLYEREVLPAGTRFAFRLVADEPPEGDAGVAGAFAALTTALRAGHIRLGAARTRGLGRVRLDEATIRETDLADRDGLRAWLTGAAAWEPATGEAGAGSSGAGVPGQLGITVGWKPVGSVFVKDSLRGGLVDILPLTSTSADGKVRLLLPGSSVKGVLRAHAERIVRTLRGTPAPATLRETLDGEALPGVVGLFGRSPRRCTGRESAAEKRAAAGWRGALEITDCHSRGHVSAEDWNSVLAASGQPADVPPEGEAAAEAPEPEPVPDRNPRRADRQAAAAARGDSRQELRAHLDRIGGDDLSWRVADHVAIDRWTGGAADSALFNVLEPVGTAWEPLALNLDCRRAGGGLPDGDPVAAVLMLLLLRDLADGWLTFGFGGTRGNGHITVTEIRFTGTDLPEPWAALVGAGTLQAVLDDPPAPVTEALARWAAVTGSDTPSPNTEEAVR